VKAARVVIQKWRFRRAEIDGTPVRQIVQTTITAAQPELSRPSDGAAAVHVNATVDGWVHVARVGSRRDDLLQQWFEPDSVDRWMALMWGQTASGQPISEDSLLNIRGELGPPSGVAIVSSIVKGDSSLELAVGFAGCNRAFEETGDWMGRGAMFSRAAAQARKYRAQPAHVATRIYTESEVACPAWMEWSRSRRPGFELVWAYSVGVYPASMRATNARADVLVSFVVDTMGTPDLATLAVMRGSDPRAVMAIPATLATWRIRPATKAGRRVRQFVVETIRFEPPPTCATPDSGPACIIREPTTVEKPRS
jgi:hypothetical protein